MFLRCCGAYNAHFATAKGVRHAYSYCRDNSYEYKCDPIAESLFSLNDAIRTICSAPDNNVHHSKPAAQRNGAPAVVGSGHANPPHTTRELYRACRAHGIDGHIGDVPVREILLCEKNQDAYDTMLQKFCLVEALYDKKEYKKPHFFAVFRIGGDKMVRLRCNIIGENVVQDIVDRIGKIPNGRRKYSPMLIAGEWRISTHADAVYECDIRKPSQAFFT